MELVRDARITRDLWQPRVYQADNFDALVNGRASAMKDGRRHWRRFLSRSTEIVRRTMLEAASKNQPPGKGYYNIAFIDIPHLTMRPDHQHEEDLAEGKLLLLDANQMAMKFRMAVRIAPEFGLSGAQHLYEQDLETEWTENVRLLLLYHSDGLDHKMFYSRLQMGNPPLLRHVPEFSIKVN